MKDRADDQEEAEAFDATYHKALDGVRAQDPPDEPANILRRKHISFQYVSYSISPSTDADGIRTLRTSLFNNDGLFKTEGTY